MKLRQKWAKLAKDNIRTDRIEAYRKSYYLARRFDIIQSKSIRKSFRKWHSLYLWKTLVRDLLHDKFKKQCQYVNKAKQEEIRKIRQQKWINLAGHLQKQAKFDNFYEGLQIIQNQNLIDDYFTDWKDKTHKTIESKHKTSQKWQKLVKNFVHHERLQDLEYARERLDLRNNWTDLMHMLMRNHMIHQCIAGQSKIIWENFAADLIYLNQRKELKLAANNLRYRRKWQQYNEIQSKINFHKQIQKQIKRDFYEDKISQMCSKLLLFYRQKLLIDAKSKLDDDREKERLIQKRNSYFKIWREKAKDSKNCQSVVKKLFDETNDYFYEQMINDTARDIQRWYRKANKERQERKYLKTKFFKLWRNLPSKIISNFFVFPQAELKIKPPKLNYSVKQLVNIGKENVKQISVASEKVLVPQHRYEKAIEDVSRFASANIKLRIPKFDVNLKPLSALSKRAIDKKIAARINERKAEIISNEIEIDFTNTIDSLFNTRKKSIPHILETKTQPPEINKRILNKVSRIAATKFAKPEFSFIPKLIQTSALSENFRMNEIPSPRRQRRRSLLAVNNHIKSILNFQDKSIKTQNNSLLNFSPLNFAPFVSGEDEIAESILDDILGDLNLQDNALTRLTKRPVPNINISHQFLEEATKSVATFDTEFAATLLQNTLENISNYKKDVLDFYGGDVPEKAASLIEFSNLDFNILSKKTEKLMNFQKSSPPFIYENYDIDLNLSFEERNLLFSLEPKSKPDIEKLIEKSDFEDNISIEFFTDYLVNIKEFSFLHEEHQVQSYDDEDLYENDLKLNELKTKTSFKEFVHKPYPSTVKDLSDFVYDLKLPEIEIENRGQRSLNALKPKEQPNIVVPTDILQEVIEDILLRDDFIEPTNLDVLRDFKQIEEVEIDIDKIINVDDIGKKLNEIPQIIVKKPTFCFDFENVPSILDDAELIEYKLDLELNIDQNINKEFGYVKKISLDEAENASFDIDLNLQNLQNENSLLEYSKSFIPLNAADSIRYDFNIPEIQTYDVSKSLFTLIPNEKLIHLQKKADEVCEDFTLTNELFIPLPKLKSSLLSYEHINIDEQESNYIQNLPNFEEIIRKNPLIYYEKHFIPYNVDEIQFVPKINLNDLPMQDRSLMSFKPLEKPVKFERDSLEVSKQFNLNLQLPDFSFEKIIDKIFNFKHDELNFYEFSDYEVDLSYDLLLSRRNPLDNFIPIIVPDPDISFIDFSLFDKINFNFIPSFNFKLLDNLVPIEESEKNEHDSNEVAHNKELLDSISENFILPEIILDKSIFNFEKINCKEQTTEYDIDFSEAFIEFNNQNALIYYEREPIPLFDAEKVTFDIEFNFDLMNDNSKFLINLTANEPISKFENEAEEVSDNIDVLSSVEQTLHIPDFSKESKLNNLKNFIKDELNIYDFNDYDVDLNLEKLLQTNTSLFNLSPIILPKVDISFIEFDSQMNFADFDSPLKSFSALSPKAFSDKNEIDAYNVANHPNLIESLLNCLQIPQIPNNSSLTNFEHHDIDIYDTTNYDIDLKLDEINIRNDSIYNLKKIEVPDVKIDFIDEEINQNLTIDFGKLSINCLENLKPIESSNKDEIDSINISKDPRFVESIINKLIIPDFGQNQFLGFFEKIYPKEQETEYFVDLSNLFDEFSFSIQEFARESIPLSFADEVSYDVDFGKFEEIIPDFTSLIYLKPNQKISKYEKDSVEISKKICPHLFIPTFNLAKMTISAPPRPKLDERFIQENSENVLENFDFDMNELNLYDNGRALYNMKKFEREFNIPDDIIPVNYLFDIKDLIQIPDKTKPMKVYKENEIPEIEIDFDHKLLTHNFEELRMVTVNPLKRLVPRKPRPQTIREHFILTRNFVNNLSRSLDLSEVQNLNFNCLLNGNLVPSQIPTNLANEIAEFIDIKLIIPDLDIKMPLENYDRERIQEIDEIYDVFDLYEADLDIDIKYDNCLMIFIPELELKRTEEIAEEFANEFSLDFDFDSLKFENALNILQPKESPDNTFLVNSVTMLDKLFIPQEILPENVTCLQNLTKISNPNMAKFADEVFPADLEINFPDMISFTPKQNIKPLNSITKIEIPPPVVGHISLDSSNLGRFSVMDNVQQLAVPLINTNVEIVRSHAKRDIRLRKSMNHLRLSLMEDIQDYFESMILKPAINELKNVTANSDVQIVVNEIDDHLEDLVYDFSDNIVVNLFENIQFCAEENNNEQNNSIENINPNEIRSPKFAVPRPLSPQKQAVPLTVDDQPSSEKISSPRSPKSTSSPIFEISIQQKPKHHKSHRKDKHKSPNSQANVVEQKIDSRKPDNEKSPASASIYEKPIQQKSDDDKSLISPKSQKSIPSPIYEKPQVQTNEKEDADNEKPLIPINPSMLQKAKSSPEKVDDKQRKVTFSDEAKIASQPKITAGEEIANIALEAAVIISSRIASLSATKFEFPFTEKIPQINQEEDELKEYLEEDLDYYLEGMTGDIVIQSMMYALDSSLGSIIHPPKVPHIRWILPTWWDPNAEHTTFSEEYSLDFNEERPKKSIPHIKWVLPDWWDPYADKPTFSEDYSADDFDNIVLNPENLIQPEKKHVSWVLPDWWDPNKMTNHDDDEYSQEFFDAIERIKELSRNRRKQSRPLMQPEYAEEEPVEEVQKKHHHHKKKSDRLPPPPKDFLDNPGPSEITQFEF